MPFPTATRGVWLLLLLLLVVVAAVAWAQEQCPGTGGQNNTCLASHKCCKDSFSDNGFGCCTIAPDAICCQAPIEGGILRNFCCPKGSTCSHQGCQPAVPKYSCGPVQGENCTSSFVCPPGPFPWKVPQNQRSVVVMGDSVSIGWTPALGSLMSLHGLGIAEHSPASGDGGARSTSSALQCIDYLLRTSDLQPLPLDSKDAFVFNFGLHDYNYGLDGLDQYEAELTNITRAVKRAVKSKLLFVLTTPAHNVPADQHGTPTNEVVVQLNARARKVMETAGVPVLDLYTPIMDKCGPVPFADSGAHACPLCAPDCKSLAVHYTPAGYKFIAQIVLEEILKL